MSDLIKPVDPRPHLNLVFCGHVDAGKSTTCGKILVMSGLVDERTIEKFEREAKDKNRESWFLAYIMDTNEEERSKGITVEVGRAQFETQNRRYTILDAPGHKSFVPNMISGASQADVACLLVSARKGEFEAGFEKGGQTREHALLAKTLGVNKIIVAINKMDDHTVNWSKERFTEIQSKVGLFLKRSCFRKEDTIFIPMSGLKGDNMRDLPTAPEAAWVQTDNIEGGGRYPTLFEVLDSITPPDRNPELSLRMPVVDGFKDMGIMVVGKIEQGRAQAGMQCVLMPGKTVCEIQNVYIDEDEILQGLPGENVRLKLKGIEEDQIHKGSVLGPVGDPCPAVAGFVAEMQVVDLLDQRPIMSAGYTCVFHAHSATEECQIVKLLEVTLKVDGVKKRQKHPRFVKTEQLVQCVIQLANYTCIDEFKKIPQLGRFTLRDEGKTIAVGKVVKVIPEAKPLKSGDGGDAHTK
jgi:peptide chain release factor subunit 3